MHTIREDTTLVGVSELRTKIEKILEEAKLHKIVIEKRNKPIAVLIAIEQYNAMEELLDGIEDLELGRMAKEREKRSSKRDYVSLRKALERLG